MVEDEEEEEEKEEIHQKVRVTIRADQSVSQTLSVRQ